MNTYTFHITPYDLAFLGAMFIGFFLAVQLALAKKINRAANRFLSLALVTMVLWLLGVLGKDIGLGAYFSHWNWLPLQFSLALGPLIVFYVLKTTRPEYKFRLNDLLHFSPLLLQQGAWVLEVRESIRTGAAIYDTLIFQQLNPVLQLLVFISVSTYLYASYRLIERFYQTLKFNRGDRHRYELRWLRNLLIGFGLLWLLWIPFTAIDYFYYHDHLGLQAYYPLYLLLAVMAIWMAAVAFLRPEVRVPGDAPSFLKPATPAELKHKGVWLKKVVKTNCYYQDPELSLSSLAEKLELTTHELSRIINTVLKKSFNDFINEYRVADVVQKMQDPAYDHITLLGIAFESGFNSQSTFTRIFKHMTGKSPLAYKNDLKKDYPSYNLGSQPRFAAIISYHETTPKWSSEKLNRNYMIRNYLKIAWRNVIRHKAHTAINVIGLALGMACCLFIFLWVQDEKGIDNFHQNGKYLYALYETISANGKTDADYNTPINYIPKTGADTASAFKMKYDFLIEDVKKEIPEIKRSAFYATGYDLPWGHPETIQVGEKMVKFEGARAGTDFFKMFSYPIIQGNAETALKDLNSIAISRRMAEIFFGSPANAIGKTVRYENKNSYVVSSVFENVTAQSSLKFDFLINFQLQTMRLEWSSNYFNTYIELADNADPDLVEAKINQLMKPLLNAPKGVTTHIGLQRFGDQYLHNVFVNGKPAGGRIEYVKIFSEVAIFILIIACINFMNLATARSVKRAKEVGVRKVVGSSRGNLIGQFFGESLVFSFLAMLLSIILLVVLLPAFNRFTGKQFGFPLAQISFWGSLISLMLITGLVAGSYPALYLSSLKPVSILKGALRFTQGSIWFRKGLTVFQFVLSIILLIATIVITRQTNYVQSAHLGYDKENMIYTRIEGELAKKNKYLLFKQQASNLPGIAMIDRTTEVPQAMNFVVNDDQITWEGKEKNTTIGIKPASVGFDFVKIMKLELAEGRDFSPAIATDSTDAFMVNEEAVRQMGMINPIGKWVKAWQKKGHIIGVLKDFHTQSLHEPIKPIMIDVKEGENFGVIIARTVPGQTKEALASLARVYKEINPNYPFSYQFVDQEYEKLYSSEMIISTLSILFAVVAIVISSMGLLGLVMFAAEQRVKEFGVRKVLGASLAQLMTLFASDFLKLIGIAFLIAAPLGWYAMSSWLQDFAYRIDISWWVFLLAGAGSFMIALFTLSYESFKTAAANPVRSLRSE